MQGEARCFVKREGLQVFILAFLWGPDRKKNSCDLDRRRQFNKKGTICLRGFEAASEGRWTNQADRTALLFILQNAAIRRYVTLVTVCLVFSLSLAAVTRVLGRFRV